MDAKIFERLSTGTCPARPSVGGLRAVSPHEPLDYEKILGEKFGQSVRNHGMLHVWGLEPDTGVRNTPSVQFHVCRHCAALYGVVVPMVENDEAP